MTWEFLYLLTRGTMIIPGEDKIRVCAYTLWICSMSTPENTGENRTFFVHSPQHKYFGKNQHLVVFENSGDISCSLRVNPNHTDESLEGRKACLSIYALNLFIDHSAEHWWEQNIFRSFTRPQVFQPSSSPAGLSTLVTSVVFYLLTRTTLMSPGKEETRACWYTFWIYSLSSLEKTDENRIFLVRSAQHKHFGKAQHLVVWALWWHQLFSTR